MGVEVVRSHWRAATNSVAPVPGGNEAAAASAVAWLLRAQEATGDDGVSLGYFPCDCEHRWRPSYPETTGYIIPTLLEYARLNDRPHIRDRALAMARWEVQVQMPSGAVQGGTVCPPEKQTPAVFNTGMVLQGLTAAYRETLDSSFLAAAQRAADFLVADMGPDGHFGTHGDFVTAAPIKTYNCLCAWALYRFGEDSGEQRYCAAAVRAVEAAIGQQAPNGWFANNCLTEPDRPLTHTIGYTLQGVLEVGLLAGRGDFIGACLRGVAPLIAQMRPDGYLAGRFDSDWEPAVRSSCLTGSAQIAVVLYRLFESTRQADHILAADRLTNWLKGLQNRDSDDPGVAGAIAGSFPMLGSYMTAGYPNWATKYFLDALLAQSRVER